MPTFELAKADKLKRMRGLRIMNYLGMIAWRKDVYGCAEQKIRMLHPLSWFWISAMLIAGVVMYGVIEICGEAKNLRSEMVWW